MFIHVNCYLHVYFIVEPITNNIKIICQCQTGQRDAIGPPLAAADILKQLERRHSALLIENSRQVAHYNECLDEIYCEVNEALRCQQVNACFNP